MLLTFIYRLLTSRKCILVLDELVETRRVLYNDVLWECIECYKRTVKTISYLDLCKSMTECRRDIPELAAIPVQLKRGTLKRLDETFKAFFHRVRSGQEPGFPRFKVRGWLDTLEVAKMKIIKSMVGLDVGLENLATLSTGEHKVGDCLKPVPGNVSLVSM